MTPHFSARQRGFTIAEMMIAMVIGLLITLAVGSLFISTQQNYRQNDATAKMQENARFALELITQDLRHAGFFGNTPDPTSGGTNYAAMTLADPTVDCGPKTANNKAGLYNLGANPGDRRFLLIFAREIADVDGGTANAVFGDCLAKAEVKADSSILLIKRAAAEPTSSTDPDPTLPEERIDATPYIYANGATSYLYTYSEGTANPLPSGIANGEHWEYQPRIYYIDDRDVLRRKQLQGLNLVSEPLAEGIEAIHVEFGINKTREAVDEGTPDFFYTPAVGNVSSADTDMNWAVSATLHVLARTTQPDPDSKYVDTKSYKLGSTGPTIGPFTEDDLIDGKVTATARSDYRYSYQRRVYSTTVVLKNIRSQVMAEEVAP